MYASAAPPSDARPSSAPGGGGADAGGGAAASTRGDPGGMQQTATPMSPAATPGMLREVLRKLRADMMEAEAHVPWSAVSAACGCLCLSKGHAICMQRPESIAAKPRCYAEAETVALPRECAGACPAGARPAQASWHGSTDPLIAFIISLVDMGHNACAQVRSMWRSRRAKWRQSTKSAETVPDLAHRLSEFRNALVTDSSFAGCGPTWQASAFALCR